MNHLQGWTSQASWSGAMKIQKLCGIFRADCVIRLELDYYGINYMIFFRANLCCFTGFQRRKTTLMMFNRQFECKGILKHLFLKQNCEICPIILAQKRKELEREKKDTCLILHGAFTLLTTLLVSEIKMAAQIPWSKVSDVLQGFL